MESEKVKDIKEALEQEINTAEYKGVSGIVSVELLKDTLTLINELEKERVLCDGTNLEETEENNILEMFCKECKRKTLKQFAERFKAKTRVIVDFYADHPDKCYNGIREVDIDETLKEFLK